MRTFANLASFAAFTTGMMARVDQNRRIALERGAQIVEDEAKRVIGTYDYNWPALAPSTLAKKTADTPLLETSEMRDSIEHKVISASEAHIGTDNEKAVWQELGTVKIPPRSFLMGAAVHKEKEVAHAIGAHVVASLKP